MNYRTKLAKITLSLAREGFTQTLIRHLAGTLQEIVGLEEAKGFISVVSQKVGDEINKAYLSALQLPYLNRKQLERVLLDLKKRIQGDFYILEEDEKKIVFGNRACPFGEKVIDRPSLCMMNSNVFGCITAKNLGYGKISLEKTIAQGNLEYRVILYLQPHGESQLSAGREYFKDKAP